MNCDEYQRRISDAMDATDPVPLPPEVESHRFECECCGHFYQLCLSLDDNLLESARPRLPANFKSSLLRRIDAGTQTLTETDKQQARLKLEQEYREALAALQKQCFALDAQSFLKAFSLVGKVSLALYLVIRVFRRIPETLAPALGSTDSVWISALLPCSIGLVALSLSIARTWRTISRTLLMR